MFVLNDDNCNLRRSLESNERDEVGKLTVDLAKLKEQHHDELKLLWEQLHSLLTELKRAEVKAAERDGKCRGCSRR
jgi:hypothetical protein